MYKYTLEECFKEYTSEDKLDDNNKFICSNCSGKGQPVLITVGCSFLRAISVMKQPKIQFH